MTDNEPTGLPRALAIVVTYKSDELFDNVATTLQAFVAQSRTHFCVTVENSGSALANQTFTRRLQGGEVRHTHLQPSANAGFAPAVNAAYDEAVRRWGQFDVVILLNPDVFAEETLLLRLVQTLYDDPSVGIAAPLLVDDQGRLDRGTARRRWTPLMLFAEIAGFGESFAKGTRLSRYITVSDTPVDVDITSGACMAVRCSPLWAAGLDCRLPLYLEDQEICHRAHQLGYRVTVYPQLVARHIGGASRSQNIDSQRNLRCMELATAPAMSMQDWTHEPIVISRIVVGAAATARIAVATAALASGFRRPWARQQIQLGKWLLAWAINPGRWGHTL